MAPNLTQIAEYFHFSPSQRDVFLGANIAFATGVLSLPVSALIGFVADVLPSRKTLYAITVAMGGLASIATGLATNYTTLYIARFVCGGCMAGTTPIAFSLLGDFFDASERNAASSGLTAAMGGGIIIGQLYSGMMGPKLGWSYPFYVCGAVAVVSAVLVQIFVSDPIRGGKEQILQDLMKSGRSYDRKLTLEGFWHAMRKNTSNFLLMVQGFFTSVPWGIIFTFLNDYLSQECGLSVQDATFLVLVFGVGSALGGIAGGWAGQATTRIHTSYMPLFMAISTFFGIFPFVGLLNGTYHSASFVPCTYAFMGGLIANLPSVSVRPALINVNLPETRGATLTAANLVVNLARGTGPVMLTSLSAVMGWSRKGSFEVLLVTNWVVGAMLLAILARTLPRDQEWVEQELITYVESRAGTVGESRSVNGTVTLAEGLQHSVRLYDAVPTSTSARTGHGMLIPEQLSQRHLLGDYYDIDDAASLVSIEDPLTSFDADAAKSSLRFMGEAIREIGDGLHREWNSARCILRRWEAGAEDDEIIGNDVTNDESFVSLLDEEDPSEYEDRSVSVEENGKYGDNDEKMHIDFEVRR